MFYLKIPYPKVDYRHHAETDSQRIVILSSGATLNACTAKRISAIYTPKQGDDDLFLWNSPQPPGRTRLAR